VRRDFGSIAFLWAVLILIGVPTLTTLWVAVRLRCVVCGLPLYAFWLLGLPQREKPSSFDSMAACPYCVDDGSGAKGDPGRVDRQREATIAVRRALVAILLFLAVVGAAFLFAVAGWLPGYQRQG
jgi:hypothetical protein